VEASGEIGASILAKLGFKSSLGEESTKSDRTSQVGHDINDLRYIADIIKESSRRLVIEDFHYMSVELCFRFEDPLGLRSVCGNHRRLESKQYANSS
jgi:hypothetical protein